MNGKVLLKCSVDKCPRTKRILWDNIFPDGTDTVQIVCPWHDDGDFHIERYFDKNGKELSANA